MTNMPGRQRASPEEAFAAISNSTRIEILQQLWEAENHTATFSELNKAVGINDSGQFNYHLSKLNNRFISKDGDEYHLRLAGMRVIGALLSGAYTQIGFAEPIAMENRCPLCEGSLIFQYEDEQAVIECQDCEQTVMQVPIPPGVFAGYESEMFPDVTEQYARNLVQQARTGFCATCEGQTHARLTTEVPPDFDESSQTPMITHECGRCGMTISSDLGVAFLDNPSVISFYQDHGIDVRERPVWQFLTVESGRVKLLEGDPLRVRITYMADDDKLDLIIDSELTVQTISRN